MSERNEVESPRIFPTFRYRDAEAMIAFLERAFGFKTHAKYVHDGVVAHAQLSFGSSMIMLGTARDDAYGKMVGGAGDNGGKAVYIAVDEVDALCERAAAAGAEILEGPVDRDHGSRDFVCRDPEGNVWSFGTYWPKANETIT